MKIIKSVVEYLKATRGFGPQYDIEEKTCAVLKCVTNEDVAGNKLYGISHLG